MRTRREPTLPTGLRKPKARKPRADSLTLEKLRAFLSPPRIAQDNVDRGKRLQSIERFRDGVRAGDLLALQSALGCCFACDDVQPNPNTTRNPRVMQMPAWLWGELVLLVHRGVSGDWPTVGGAGAPSRRELNIDRDLWRAWHVLKARRDGSPWETVFEHVAEQSGGRAGSVSAIEKSYRRVAQNLRNDPDYYRRLPHASAVVLNAAVGPPYRG